MGNKYRAIVSITFDDDDLAELAENVGCEPDEMNASDAIDGELSNMSFGNTWIEQLFRNGKPTIMRLSGGIKVEVNEHDED